MSKKAKVTYAFHVCPQCGERMRFIRAIDCPVKGTGEIVVKYLRQCPACGIQTLRKSTGSANEIKGEMNG